MASPGYQQQTNNMQQAGAYPNSMYGFKSASQLFAPVAAQIPKYCFADEKYWFVIEAELENGRRWELSRYYEDFYDFQIALLTEFPVEAGNTPAQKRTLPYMPGPVNYVTDQITQGRLRNLDEYVKNLLAQPPHISRCNLVKQFFAPREGDYEIEPNPENDDYRLSGQSSTESPGDAASRQSSRNNLNGNAYGVGSATPRQPGSGGFNGPPGMAPQIPSLPPQQLSYAPLSSGMNQGTPSMKVKFHFNGELYAIRVPTDVSFQQLYDKVCERLRIPPGDELQLSYKDEQTNDKPSLLSDNDLNRALERNEKLFLFAELV